MLDGMKRVVSLNPDVTLDEGKRRAEWLEAVDAFLRVNQDVLTMAELLRALLNANDDAPGDRALSS
jgi:hypothetical protein